MKDESWKTMEQWVDSFVYPDAYEVSSLGRVRSKTILVKNSRNDSLKKRTGRILVLSSNPAGYLKCHLSFDGIKTTQMVHRLVAYSFLSGDLSMTINHKNGLKHDNRLDNLEIVSQKQNIHHAVSIGLTVAARGSKSGRATILEKDVVVIKELKKIGLSYPEIAKITGVTVKVIGDICRGRTWTHV